MKKNAYIILMLLSCAAAGTGFCANNAGTGAAAFLIDYRIPFMIVGIGVNAVGVIIAARRLRRAPAVHARPHEEVETCAAA